MAEQNRRRDSQSFVEDFSRLVGSRVVRGPHWKWFKQDGGEGYVGTIKNLVSTSEVMVVWDHNGTRANHRYAGEFDLRILDTSPCGIVHEAVRCYECSQYPLRGVRWTCATCLLDKNDGVDLCSKCYHHDRHSIKHAFYRILMPSSQKNVRIKRVLVEPRKYSKKLAYRGIYKGARVMHGVDFQWKDQEKSDLKGKVIEVKDWNASSFQSAVFVEWDDGSRNLYRLGFNGMTDLKCIEEAKGGYYYRDHLPLFGERTFKRASNLIYGENNSEEELRSAATTTKPYAKLNDVVRINMDVEMLQALQIGHGGWCEAMLECLNSTGVITRIDEDNDFEVTYPSGNKWTFNPAVLTLASPASTNSEMLAQHNATSPIQSFPSNNEPNRGQTNHLLRPTEMTKQLVLKNTNNPDQIETNECALVAAGAHRKSELFNDIDKYSNIETNKFMMNDLVEICADLQKIKVLQVGHGEWAEAMAPTLGQIGKVLKVYPDNDLKIEVCGTTWTFNPLAVTKLDATKILFLRNFNEELVKAAANGECAKCEYILRMPGSNVNCLFNGHTALHAACQNGHIAIIEILLKHNADLEIEDKDGDRAIHHAAFGNEPKVIEYLHSMSTLDKRTTDAQNWSRPTLDLNSRNKKLQTALHIAVNKGYVQVVKLLIELGCHVSLQDYEGDTPLHDAVSKNNDILAKILLDANADLAATNRTGFNCIHHAALRGNQQIVKFILEKLRSSQKEWLVDQRKEDGFTALHLATLNNYNSIAALLVEFDQIDLNVTNHNQQSALHLAVERLNYEIAKLLLGKGCDVNAQDKEGNTPLHCVLKDYSMVQIRKENISSKSGEKTSRKKPWELTDDDFSVKTCSLLIDHGGNIYIKNKNNESAIDLCNDPDFIKLLIKLYNEKQSQAKPAAVEAATSATLECIICSARSTRSTLLKPCNHIIACETCSSRLKRCLICKRDIVERVQLNECEICGERPACVLAEPCGHCSTCEKCADMVKKCVTCHMPVQHMSSGCTSRVFESSRGAATSDVVKLKQELQGLKEQTMCPVCLDKMKNMVFLCGHSTCQMCGDRICECPICRKPIQKRILIY